MLTLPSPVKTKHDYLHAVFSSWCSTNSVRTLKGEHMDIMTIRYYYCCLDHLLQLFTKVSLWSVNKLKAACTSMQHKVSLCTDAIQCIIESCNWWCSQMDCNQITDSTKQCYSKFIWFHHCNLLIRTWELYLSCH